MAKTMDPKTMTIEQRKAALRCREASLENFDEDVANRLSNCQQNTIASLDKFSQWMYYFFLIHVYKTTLSKLFFHKLFIL